MASYMWQVLIPKSFASSVTWSARVASILNVTALRSGPRIIFLSWFLIMIHCFY